MNTNLLTNIMTIVGIVLGMLGYNDAFVGATMNDATALIGAILTAIGAGGNIYDRFKAGKELDETKVALNDMTALASVRNPDAV